MKVLFITAFLPMDFGSGSAMRSFQLLRELEKEAQVDVISANNWPIDSAVLKEFNGNYLGHLTIPAKSWYLGKPKPISTDLQNLVNLDDYDFVFSRYYNPAYWLGLFNLNNLILDCDDCILEMLENEYRDSKRNVVKRALSFIRHRLFKDRYLHTLELPSACIYSRHSAHSKLIANAFELPNKLSPATGTSQADVTTVNNGTNVLFVGVLNYGPNIDGLNHFLESIWPSVIEAVPDTRLTIVGANAKKRKAKRWAAHRNVDYQGYVRNIEDAYQQADVCVVPVYRGGGVHIKIMEAFKYNKPVVITDEAQRGYHNKIKDGEHAFIAGTDNEFIEKLSSLLSDEALRDRISQQAMQIFNDEFSIESYDPTMKKIIAAATKKAQHSNHSLNKLRNPSDEVSISN